MAWARDVLATGEPLVVNEYAYGKTVCGEERRFDIRITRVNGCLSWTWRDVTERCVAAQKLVESEEKYRLLAQNSSDIVLLSDASGKTRWVSPSVERELGWAVGELLGRPPSVLFVSPFEDYERHRDSLCSPDSTASMRAILKSKDGSPHWVEVHSSAHAAPNGFVSGVVSSVRIIDEQVEAERKLEARARRDELTHLANRKELLDHLCSLEKRRQRTGKGMAVLFVDVDNFKKINDDYGHAAGDSVLRQVAERLRSCLRTGDDIAARLGGDEMVVVLEGTHSQEDAVAVAEKIRRSVSTPILVEGRKIEATVSIGVTPWFPSKHPSDILSVADKAMYKAKWLGRGQVVRMLTPTPLDIGPFRHAPGVRPLS